MVGRDSAVGLALASRPRSVPSSSTLRRREQEGREERRSGREILREWWAAQEGTEATKRSRVDGSAEPAEARLRNERAPRIGCGGDEVACLHPRYQESARLQEKRPSAGLSSRVRRHPCVRGRPTLRRRAQCLASVQLRSTLLQMRTTLSIRLPDELDQWLEEESRRTGLPKGVIVRQHLEASRTRKACQPFLDLAGSVEGKPGLSRKKGFQK